MSEAASPGTGRCAERRVPGYDIVVIGGSAGGMEALAEVVRSLPPDLPAAIFVALHFPAHSPSLLPGILDRQGQLPAAAANDGEAIEPGRIYVAKPDHHLLIERGYVRLSHGPKENRHRPALDPMFRTAARAYGPRVVGVVLSGALDDGTVGLYEVKAHGGVAIVQTPDEALFPGMPRSALEQVDVDYCLPAAEIGAKLASLAHEPVRKQEELQVSLVGVDSGLAEEEPSAVSGGKRAETPTDLSCPECHGVLNDLRDGQLVQYRCRVGHTYSPENLDAAQSDGVESALWIALRALEERSALARRLQTRAQERGHQQAAARFEERARSAEQRAALVREALLGESEPG